MLSSSFKKCLSLVDRMMLRITKDSMQNKLRAVLLVCVCTCCTLLTSCSRPKNIIPYAHPDAKVFTSVINTINKGNSDSANVVGTVKTGDDVVKLRLEVKGGDTAAKYIYIVYAGDNGSFIPLPVPTTTNEFGTFTGGNSSTYSLKVPSLTRFNLDIFVNVRNTAVATNDVYKIWITDSIGSFTMPAYNRILGTATFNLLYNSTALTDTYTSSTLYLSSQSARTYGNLLSTAGLIGAMDSTAYALSPKSADIRLVTLTLGKKDNNSLALFLYPLTSCKLIPQ
jgi:hypothetical protein